MSSKLSGSVYAPFMKPIRFFAFFLGALIGNHLRHRFPRLGDDKWFSRRNLVDQPREMRLGCVNVDGAHRILQ